MELSDETLMAFADGELPGSEAARISAAMADDPDLRRRVERFRSVRRALRSTYDAVAKEPIPERLRALLGEVSTDTPVTQSAPVVAIAPKRRQIAVGPPVWAALAASLIVGVIAGRISASANDSLLIAEAGQVRAGAALARVLDTRLASAPENIDANLRVGLSFRNQDGALCRTFSESGAESGVSGLACRADDAWLIRIAAADAGASTEYRQAGSGAPAVLAMVDALMAGEPLDEAQEAEARANHWR
jgi:hypothetical protein